MVTVYPQELRMPKKRGLHTVHPRHHHIQQIKGEPLPPGGSTYEKAIKVTVDKDAHNCFAVSVSTYVTATHSGWARDDLNKASQEGLIDKSLLGNNYTTGIGRSTGSTSYKTTYTGVCVNPYGRSSTINLTSFDFMAIKDR